MNRLPGIQDTAYRLLTQNADLLYRHTATWSDGTNCRFSVQDPSKTDQGTRLAQRLTGTVEVLDVRLLTVAPGMSCPAAGAQVAWDGGLLTIIDWTQPSDFTGQSKGICRLTR